MLWLKRLAKGKSYLLNPETKGGLGKTKRVSGRKKIL
tara:strand:- start:917 stop:1027 length:111 start_codon:yes stop_codon:yes gene_type:complete